MFSFIWILTLILSLFTFLLSYTYGSINVKCLYGKNKNYNFYEIIILLLTFLLITSNRNGVDIINYRNMYYYFFDIFNTVSITEIVYTGLSLLFSSLGVNFYVFRALLTFITGLMAIKTLKKLDFNINFFILFYLPALMFMDSMLIKNTSALFILIWALKFVFCEDIKNRYVKLFISILICGGFHSAFYFYLLILLYPLDTKKSFKILKLITYIMLFLIIIITFINHNKIPFVDKLFSIFFEGTDKRKNQYNTSGHFGFLYPTFLHLSMLYGLKIYSKNVEKTNERQFKFVKFSIYLNEITLLIIPFLMMNVVFYRFFRNSYVISLIALIIIIKNSKKKNDLYSEILILIFNFVMWLIFELFMFGSPKLLMFPILNEGVMFYE